MIYKRKTENIAMSRWYRALPFWERVSMLTQVQESGCHVFTGSKDECGYGRINRDGKLVRLHRAVWERDNGTIPNGMVVCHTCDNPACINSTHLFTGTQVDNIKDMDKKGRRRTLIGSQQSQAKLSEEEIPKIKQRHGAGFSIAFISRMYGVSEGAIRAVVKGRTWRHVQWP